MPSMTYLMLRSARRARLEARTALLQLFLFIAVRFPDILEGRDLLCRKLLIQYPVSPILPALHRLLLRWHGSRPAPRIRSVG
jgi:hypothetical protein